MPHLKYPTDEAPRTCDLFDHAWPDVLDHAARCDKCGLAYDDWSEPA